MMASLNSKQNVRESAFASRQPASCTRRKHTVQARTFYFIFGKGYAVLIAALSQTRTIFIVVVVTSGNKIYYIFVVFEVPALFITQR